MHTSYLLHTSTSFLIPLPCLYLLLPFSPSFYVCSPPSSFYFLFFLFFYRYSNSSSLPPSYPLSLPYLLRPSLLRPSLPPSINFLHWSAARYVLSTSHASIFVLPQSPLLPFSLPASNRHISSPLLHRYGLIFHRHHFLVSPHM